MCWHNLHICSHERLKLENINDCTWKKSVVPAGKGNAEETRLTCQHRPNHFTQLDRLQWVTVYISGITWLDWARLLFLQTPSKSHREIHCAISALAAGFKLPLLYCSWSAKTYTWATKIKSSLSVSQGCLSLVFLPQRTFYSGGKKYVACQRVWHCTKFIKGIG